MSDEIVNYLLNAIRLYSEADSYPDLLRLACIDAGEALRKLALQEISGDESDKSIISQYLSDLQINYVRGELLNYWGLRNSVVHDYRELIDIDTHDRNIPKKEDIECFLKLMIQLFSKVGLLPEEYRTRPLEQFLTEAFITYELGFSIPSPCTWNIREAGNSVHFYTGDVNISVTVWQSKSENERLSRIREKGLELLPKSVQCRERSVRSRGRDSSTGNVVYVSYLFSDWFYEIEYDYGANRYEIYSKLFEKMYKNFKPLRNPLLLHDKTVKVINEKEFPHSEVIRIKARYKLNPLHKGIEVFINDEHEVRAETARVKAEAMYGRIAEANDPQDQAVYEYCNGNITQEEFTKLSSDTRCVLKSIKVGDNILHPDILVY